jgi:tyrosine-specific transport protein
VTELMGIKKKRKMDKKFWSATFTLTGTIIGAGILGLPYVFSKSGIIIGLSWLVVLGLIVLYIFLCLGEISLRTKGRHHLVGYAEKYLGKWGKRIMLIAVTFAVYSALLAYLIGEGRSFSQLFTGSLDYSVHFALGFWFFMTLFLREGLKGLKRIETWGVLGIFFVIFGIFVYYSPEITLNNYLYNDFNHLLLPFGVVLFALLGFTSIPEVRLELKGKEKFFKKTIIFGVLIPIFIYAVFTLIFVGVLGEEISEVATLSFEWPVTLLGIFTMFTSYFVLSFALKDIYSYDFKYSKTIDFVLVSLAPLLIYLVLNSLNFLNFVGVLSIGGSLAGGIKGILVLIMHRTAKKEGDRRPEYSIFSNLFLSFIICLLLVFGIFFGIRSLC